MIYSPVQAISVPCPVRNFSHCLADGCPMWRWFDHEQGFCGMGGPVSKRPEPPKPEPEQEPEDSSEMKHPKDIKPPVILKGPARSSGDPSGRVPRVTRPSLARKARR